MRWQHRRRSSNIEDRQRAGGKAVAGGGGMFLVMALVVFLLGGDPSSLIGEGLERTVSGHMQGQSQLSEEETKELAEFTSVVLASTEDVWREIYAQNGGVYKEPKLVLFTGVVNSSCGRAGSATGPFYCPPDQSIYIDLSFYKDLKSKLKAPGDFAQAYVIAHEVGHHIQNMTGVIPEVTKAKRRTSKKRANALQVRVELQADCYAGVWARKVKENYNMIEAGDIDEALNAASQIGDDRLQKQSRGYVVPDSFTHGSSAQRKTWFKRGFESGQISSCDTFQTGVI